MTTKDEAIHNAQSAIEYTLRALDNGNDLTYAKSCLQRALAAIKQAQEPVNSEDRATIAGLEASIGHLSALVNQQLLLLEEVDINLGVDGMGVPLDDDQSPTIAKVREHLAAMAPPEPAPKQAEPEGYKLVPVEPTQEMLDSVVTTLDDHLLGQDAEKQYREDWAAMLAAAPTPPEAK